jgi:hypothetical protein
MTLAVVVANLLVPAGVLLFGWNAAAAVFLIWLDTAIVSLRLAVLIFAAASPLFVRPPGTHRGGWMIGIGIGMAFFAPIFVAAPLMVGMELYDSLRTQFPQGPLAAAFADPVIYLWIAIEIALRGVQVLGRAREILSQPALAASFTAQIAEQFLALMFRMVILIHLAWLASWFARPGLLLFLFAASAFLAYTELHENWLRQLYGRWRRLEEQLRARAKNKANP